MTAAIDVTDISVDAGGDPGGRGAAPHNSAALIAADMPRLPGEPSDKQAVEIILRRFCKMYPGVGYNQVSVIRTNPLIRFSNLDIG